MQKMIRDKQSEVDVLKDMVNSSKGEIRTKELTISKMKKRIETLEKINGL